jgi:predicted translin family RNA/ssDNA-binding protein
MELTKENLSDLTMRVKELLKPWHRRKVSNSSVLSQLEYVDGIIFIRLFRDQTISKEDEILAVGSKGNSIDDGIAVFNAS